MIENLINDEFKQDLIKASEFLDKYDYFRVLTHYDGDGTSAAIILSNLLINKKKKFHLGFIKELSREPFIERYKEEGDLPLILCDAGSDQVKFLEENNDILILDHHFFENGNEKDNVLNINARNYNINGTTEACGATMAYIFSLFVDEKKNSKMLPFMMSGAIADKQDLGGFKGLNKLLIENFGVYISKKHRLNLDDIPLKDSILYSSEPFFLGLTGENKGTMDFIKKLNLDPEKKISELNDDEVSTLAKSLYVKLIEQKCQSEAISTIEIDDYVTDSGVYIYQLSRIIDSCAKLGENGLPVEKYLGKYEDIKLDEEMIQIKKRYETKIIDYINRSYKMIDKLKNVQFFYTPENEMAGSISGILALYLADQKRPIFGFNVGEETTLISSRGNRRLVEKGLNLSAVMREATKKFNGTGGGHDIAAGGSIKRGMERQFIEYVDELVGKQILIREKF